MHRRQTPRKAPIPCDKSSHSDSRPNPWCSHFLCNPDRPQLDVGPKGGRGLFGERQLGRLGVAVC
jgi:hypothetical protein